MKVFSVLASVAAVLVALSSTVDAQRLLRSEASAQTDSTVTADFAALGSMGGSSFTPGNVAAGSSFGDLDKESGSMTGRRPSGSMHRGGGGAGRGFGSGNGMHNVGSGDGFAHGSGSFGGHGGIGGHGHPQGMGGGSFSSGSFAGSFGGHGDFDGSGFSGGHVGGSFGGNPPSIGSGDAHSTAAGATSSVAASSSA